MPVYVSIDAFLIDCGRRGLARRTVQAYAERLHLLDTARNGREWSDLGRDDIEKWLDRHASCSQTRASYRSTACTFYDWMISRGTCDENPARQTVRPRVKRGQPRPIRTDDLARALRAADPRMRTILCLGAYAGLRAAEIAALRVDDIDLRAEMLYVRHGKGDKPRQVPIHAELAAALEDLPMPVRGPVVTTNRHTGFSGGRTITQAVAQYLRGLGINCTAHQLRHWFGTRIVEQADIQTAAHLLGHASVVTTQVYARWPEQRGRAAIEHLPPAA